MLRAEHNTHLEFPVHNDNVPSMKARRKAPIPLFTFLFAISFCCSALYAADDGETLSRAWAEYRFQNFSMADNLFSIVLDDEQSTPDEIIQARYGQALITHYRLDGRNPEKALESYKEILAQLDPDSPYRNNLYLNIGRASMGLETPDISTARRYFRKVNHQHGGSTGVELHEAAIELANTYTIFQTNAAFHDAIDLLVRHISLYPDNPLVSTMYGYCANLALYLKDYPVARDFLVTWDSIGVVNHKRKHNVAFQIAYISETMLSDPETAMKYYEKVIEDETNELVYFCKLRLARLKGEDIQP